MLSAEQLQQNYSELRRRINEYFPTNRTTAIISMVDDLEDRFMFAPASSFEYFHNAFPGGYTDHILRVDTFATKVYELWKTVGMRIDFRVEELHFAALHHDLGKLGLPGTGMEHYQPNSSDWHVKNQGKIYTKNPNVYNMNVTDRGFFLLQYYGIQYTVNEMIGIRTTDGMYEENNKEYLAGFNLETKLRNSLPFILHQADIMAFRYEFEQWATGKFNFNPNVGGNVPQMTIEVLPKKEKNNPALTAFDDLFKI